MPDDALGPDLERLRNKYRAKLPQLLAELEALLPEPGASDEETRWVEAYRLAHRIKGTSGSYRFDRLSGELQRIEDALEEVVYGAAPAEARRERIQSALAAARGGLSESD